jgi:hypothetical protein
MEDEMKVTKTTLRAALLQWEKAAREAQWASGRDKSPEEVAESSADYLWRVLSGEIA